MNGQVHLERERALFAVQKETERRTAAQRAALRLLCGLDLDTILVGSRQVKLEAIAKIRRLLRREQLKGWQRHYAYDLNRHIALKRAATMLSQVGDS